MLQSITAEQILASGLGILAFIPATICTGYATAYWTDLYSFRSRSFVERIIWSLPLSLAISIISSVLLSRAMSVDCAAVFFIIATLISAGFGISEWRQKRIDGKKIVWGGNRSTRIGLILCFLWVTTVVLSLVDFQWNEHLYLNMAAYDQSFRIDWTASVLHTGVPPANPLYQYGHRSGLRTFYFWYVMCAAVVRYSHLPVRAVVTASSAWAVLNLLAIVGLYLKHFLKRGSALRRQFLISMGLIGVTGLDLCVVLWNVTHGRGLAPDTESWSDGQIASWLDSFLWVPHHVASLVCCELAFLLAWMPSKARGQDGLLTAILIGMALSSGFGTSIFVVFAFFLMMVTWAIWQMLSKREKSRARRAIYGGAIAIVLLSPYLRELSLEPSGNSSRVFSLAVRQMFPPDKLLTLNLFQNIANDHSAEFARNLANLVLLLPGYTIELGFYLAVLLIYARWAITHQDHLTAEHESLLFMALATLPYISFIRSGVLQTNDFGWRGALILQFPLLLLGSELIVSWSSVRRKSVVDPKMPGKVPEWLRGLCVIALCVGFAGTVVQALLLRVSMPLLDLPGASPQQRGAISHNAYIAYSGYRELAKVAPAGATVQYNPNPSVLYANIVDIADVERQVAMFSDRAECGSLWGGISAGCANMSRDIDALFRGLDSTQARATCAKYGIQFLVARVYDPAWKDRNGWVWTLKPVTAHKEFRAVDCR